MDANRQFTKEEADALSRKDKEEVLRERGVAFAETDSDDFIVNHIMYSNKLV